MCPDTILQDPHLGEGGKGGGEPKELASCNGISLGSTSMRSRSRSGSAGLGGTLECTKCKGKKKKKRQSYLCSIPMSHDVMIPQNNACATVQDIELFLATVFLKLSISIRK